MSYQKIDIDGYYYEGIDRTNDYRQIFSEYPVGKTILDVGCNNGFYILKAISEGATYAVGVDNHNKFLDVGMDAARFLKYTNIDFVQLDVLKDYLPDQKFDIVLCLNLVHHFNNMGEVVLLFKRIYDRSKEAMIFEVLYCNKKWEIRSNDKGNKKIHLSVEYFEQIFSDCFIESFDSKVTKDRKIIRVEK